jgi:adenylate cyclase
MGGAFLVEFSSAFEAVRCGCGLQSVLHEHNERRSEGEKTVLRIGVHLGDFVHSGGDVLGDAVNIASRVEPLATPGAISIAEHVYEQVKNRLGFPLVSVGEQELRNIHERVEIYRVILPWEEAHSSEPEALDRHRLAVLPLANISLDPKGTSILQTA